MSKIIIGHAVVDENGKAAGGKIGDQKGNEICTREWYSSSWNVYLECTDEELADKAAKIMEEICNDPNFGYDQSQRTTGYTSIVANKNKVKGAKGEFDCSSLVAACYKLAGLNINVNCTTRNLRAALLATGKFTAYTYDYRLKSANLAKRGSLYLSEGKHVAMVLHNPTLKKETIYTVVKGDNLTKIANKYKVTVDDIVKWNNIKNPNLISIGQKLKIVSIFKY